MNQTEVPVVLPEEAPMTLNCAYETLDSAPYLFWYVQYPNRAPQLLLKGSTANPRAEEQGFQATLVKSDKTFHLQKRSVQTSDSAVYYCALRDTVRRAAGGAEHKPKGRRRAEVSSLRSENYICFLGRVDFRVFLENEPKLRANS